MKAIDCKAYKTSDSTSPDAEGRRRNEHNSPSLLSPYHKNAAETPSGYGGAYYFDMQQKVMNFTTLTFDDLTFTDNSADGSGKAVFVATFYSSILYDDCWNSLIPQSSTTLTESETYQAGIKTSQTEVTTEDLSSYINASETSEEVTGFRFSTLHVILIIGSIIILLLIIAIVSALVCVHCIYPQKQHSTDKNKNLDDDDGDEMVFASEYDPNATVLRSSWTLRCYLMFHLLLSFGLH